MEPPPETLIIGAGPAGLAVAACLKQRRVSCVIVERATTVGSSWHRHYERLHLHTDRAHSALPYLDFPAETPRYPSREQLIAYLDHYARHFELSPRLGEAVQSVQPCEGGWTTTTTRGVHRSRQLVVATGYNAVPRVPQWPGQERFQGRILHSSEYLNGAPFRGQRVLVVGFGNSGGEIAIDLHEHGAQVALSVRGAVNVIPREILGLPILAISIPLSRLPARVADALAAPLLRLTVGDITRLGFRKLAVGPITQIRTTSRVPLIDSGTLRLIREGHIEVLGDVRTVSERTVSFADDGSRSFDAIVLATGFQPGVDRFLGPEAQGKTGLYFCGFRVSPTGMLRDIAHEARAIAEHIVRAAAARLSATHGAAR